MRGWLVIVLWVLLAAACGEGPEPANGRAREFHANDPAGDLDAPSPSDSEADVDAPEPPPGAAAAGQLVTAEADGVMYELWMDDGCAYLRITPAGEDPSTESRCRFLDGFWADHTDDCLRPARVPQGGDSAASQPRPHCEVEVPRVFYGSGGSVRWLCFAHHRDESLGPVDRVEVDGLFIAIEPPGVEWVVPHLYTGDGKRWGDPPLDAPSSVIYAMCETDPPWVRGDAFPTYVHAIVRFAEDFEAEGGDVLVFDPGTGAAGFSLGNAEDGFMEAGFEAWTDATELTVGYSRAGGLDTLTIGTYPLPEAILAELSNAWECFDAVVLSIEVSVAILDADPDAVRLSALTSREANELAPFPVTGLESDRVPGTPCPGSGTERQLEESPQIDLVVEGTYRIVVSDEVFGLGAGWFLDVFDTDMSGFSYGLDELANLEEDLYGSYLFPGTELRISLSRSMEDGRRDQQGFAVPDLPEGYGPPYVLEVRITGYDDSDEGPTFGADDVILGWVED